MSTCNIEGCNHHIKGSASPTKHIGQSWYDFGICACCGIEFFPERCYYSSYVCTKLIRKELIAYSKVEEAIGQLKVLNKSITKAFHQ
jgi:hypothetical protein